MHGPPKLVLDLGQLRPHPLRVKTNDGYQYAFTIQAYESQRRHLNGELRYVWRAGVEIYWKMSVLSDPTSADPDRSGLKSTLMGRTPFVAPTPIHGQFSIRRYSPIAHEIRAARALAW